MDNKKIKEAVRKGYATYAKNESTCCGPIEVCCGNSKDPKEISKTIGYSKEQMKSVPEESNLGLGCGNPTAIASLKKGEVVLDLGSGAGFDCFLAANKVGEKGKVIGVDMTPEMIKKAEQNAIVNGYSNVEINSNAWGPFEMNKAWGNSPDNVYVIGDSGSIAHYDNGTWQKLESGTDVDLLDIWGSSDGNVWTCGWTDFKPTVLIRIENQRVVKVFESRNNLFSYDPCFLTGAFYSVWSDEFNRLYILTWYDLYRCEDINCRQVKSFWGQNYLEWASYSIRGSSINNIVTVGQYGRIWHFNGVSWRFFEELVQPTDRLRSVSVKNDLVVSVGYRYLNAIEQFGLIYLGRK